MTLKGFDVNIKQEGGRGFKGRNLGHWSMRNNCESLLTQECGIEWEARTEDGSCTGARSEQRQRGAKRRGCVAIRITRIHSVLY